MGSQWRSSFLATAIAVLAFGVAMGYLEAAVVVYLRAALGLGPLDAVPVVDRGEFEAFAGIEIDSRTRDAADDRRRRLALWPHPA